MTMTTNKFVIKRLALMSTEQPPDGRPFTARHYYYSFPRIFSDEVSDTEQASEPKSAPMSKQPIVKVPIIAKEKSIPKVTGIPDDFK